MGIGSDSPAPAEEEALDGWLLHLIPLLSSDRVFQCLADPSSSSPSVDSSFGSCSRAKYTWSLEHQHSRASPIAGIHLQRRWPALTVPSTHWYQVS
ncbi:hypothetical protein BT96DRAFT_30137 [Gymnopus androsaceus JB14]|uniref:Uncharacterized protein n=1 Tax=Gymnopus androsaceus JB14 TaxID=1447944 RepID=A0A6A4ICC8_9AGAR|nr:hypothetical protein BT96DRAFT_30137 [Gymnopus androsaceus JB14]